MGLLTEGTPLTWAETKKYAEHVQKHGIQQFINVYHKLKDRTNDGLKWGDEVCVILFFSVIIILCIFALSHQCQSVR